MVRGQRAVLRDVIALSRYATAAGIGLEGQAVAAVVPGFTARGNEHAALALIAPGEAAGAEALSGLAVVVADALGRYVIAGVGRCAPGSAELEDITGSASVVI